jgi:hypothetical protein
VSRATYVSWLVDYMETTFLSSTAPVWVERVEAEQVVLMLKEFQREHPAPPGYYHLYYDHHHCYC